MTGNDELRAAQQDVQRICAQISAPSQNWSENRLENWKEIVIIIIIKVLYVR